MKIRTLLASAAALALAACGGGHEGANDSSPTESDAVATDNLAAPAPQGNSQ